MNTERGRLYNVEGLDAAGKSTLAKELQKKFDGVMTYSPPDWMRPYRTFSTTRQPIFGSCIMRIVISGLTGLWYVLFWNVTGDMYSRTGHG